MGRSAAVCIGVSSLVRHAVSSKRTKQRVAIVVRTPRLCVCVWCVLLAPGSYGVIRIVKFAMGISMVLHFIACGWQLIRIFELDESESGATQTWIHTAGWKSEPATGPWKGRRPEERVGRAYVFGRMCFVFWL